MKGKKSIAAGVLATSIYSLSNSAFGFTMLTVVLLAEAGIAIKNIVE